MLKLARTALITAAALTLPVGFASAISVDGQIGDWGVTGLANDTANYAGVAGTAWENTHWEGDGWLFPGGGAQNYDVEFLALHLDGGSMFGVVMSGQRADNGFSNYSPGDVVIQAYDANLGKDVFFGIEVGGGTGGVALSSVGLNDPGSSYQLKSSGYTQSVSGAPYNAGELVRDAGFIGGQPFNNPATGGSDKVQIVNDPASTSQGLVENFIFNQDVSLGQHSVIEFEIKLSQLNLGSGGFVKNMVWSPGCGNDHGLATPTPEPTAALLMFAGVLTMKAGAFRRRRS